MSRLWDFNLNLENSKLLLLALVSQHPADSFLSVWMRAFDDLVPVLSQNCLTIPLFSLITVTALREEAVLWQ
jgi:hypothetical protein